MLRLPRENELRIQVRAALWRYYQGDRDRVERMFAIIDPVIVEWVKESDGHTIRAAGLME